MSDIKFGDYQVVLFGFEATEDYSMETEKPIKVMPTTTIAELCKIIDPNYGRIEIRLTHNPLKVEL